MLAEVLKSYQPYLPFMMIGALALAIIGVFLFLKMGRRFIVTSKRRQALARPPAMKPTFRERMRKLKHGIIKVKHKSVSLYKNIKPSPQKTDLQASFEKAQDLLTMYFAGENHLYDLPLYLCLGPAGSEKETLFNKADLEKPLGAFLDEERDPNGSGLTWFFFEGGIVLSVKGEALINAESLTSDQNMWQELITLLNLYRPRRPLDGLILVMSPEDITASSERSYEDITSRAKFMAQKVWTLSQDTAMRLPVYMIIHQCERLCGFQEFAKTIPLPYHQEIFGWSSPFETSKVFDTTWVHDIFKTLTRSMNAIRESLFTLKNISKDDLDGVMRFPYMFQRLKKGLSLTLTQLLKQNAYYDPLIFRGIYFTGTLEETQDHTAQKGDDRPEETSSHTQKSLFLKDILTKKIFPERALGGPIRRLLVSTNTWMNRLKASALLVAVAWGLGLALCLNSLSKTQKIFMPSLEGIHHSLQGIHQKGGYQDTPPFKDFLTKEALKNIQLFGDINARSTKYVFMPFSWFSDLDSRVEKAFTKAYDAIILPAMYYAFTKKIQDLLSIHRISFSKVHKHRHHVNPTFSDSFHTLKGFVDQVRTFEHYAQTFNHLELTKRTQDLESLIHYLFEKKLPVSFSFHSNFYKKALSKTHNKDIDLVSYKSMASQKTHLLFKIFLTDAFNIQKNLPILSLLENRLGLISSVKTAETLENHDIRKTVHQATAAADLISSGGLSWIDMRHFNPSHDYEKMMDAMASSLLLGHDIARDMKHSAQKAFGAFKMRLSHFRAPITGPFFRVHHDTLVSEPSKGLVLFIDTLNGFLAEPFMQPSQDRALKKTIPAGKMLFWDENLLRKAQERVDTFEHYVKNTLSTLPSAYRDLCRVMGRHQTSKQVSNMVSEAQIFHDLPVNLVGFSTRELLYSQIQNVTSVTPSFVKLLGMFEDGGYVTQNAALREILVKHNYSILENIDKLLAFDNLYNGREESFDWWDGSKNAGLKAFAVHSIRDMNTYLKAQRFRIKFMAEKMAAPILTLLSMGYLEDIPYDLPLVQKWSQISAILSQYDTQSPDNPLKRLEKFLSHDANHVTLENCDVLEEDAQDFDQAGDYFTEVRSRFAREMLRRCEDLSGKRAMARYNKAASFFNINLAGRFPFTKEDVCPEGESFEANPGDVQTFLKLLDTLTPHDLQVLQHISVSTRERDSVKAFLQKMDSVRPLIQASLDLGRSENIPQVRMDVNFRTHRHLEKGADKIIDWTMDFGDHKIHYRDSKKEAFWRVGQPIEIMLRWAADAELKPRPDVKTPHIKVLDTKTYFNYRGRWALIRLLRQHALPESRFDQSLMPRPQTLRFEVATALQNHCYQGPQVMKKNLTTESARIFCDLDIHVPVKDITQTDEAVSLEEMARLAYPQFATEAPVISRLRLTRRRGKES